jgi:myo-inositol-1(or 4)-monophosphatase
VAVFADRLADTSRRILLGRFDEAHVAIAGTEHTTDVDLAMEAAVLDLVDGLFEPATVLAEEWFAAHGAERHPGRRLRAVVDALDGSRFYNAGRPNFATTVAFQLDGALLAGLVYEPVADARYLAVAGAGAWRDGRRLRARPGAPRDVRSKPFGPALDAVLDPLRRHGYAIDRLHGTAFTLCRAAEGEHACVVKGIFVDRGVARVWGCAAGALLCREAGLSVLTPGGEEWTPAAAGLVVCDAPARELLERTAWA